MVTDGPFSLVDKQDIFIIHLSSSDWKEKRDGLLYIRRGDIIMGYA